MLLETGGGSASPTAVALCIAYSDDIGIWSDDPIRELSDIKQHADLKIDPESRSMVYVGED